MSQGIEIISHLIYDWAEEGLKKAGGNQMEQDVADIRTVTF